MQLDKRWKMTVRAFIAIVLGYLAFKLIPDKYSYWVMLTVIILLPSTTGATFKKAVARVSGTLIGVLFGLFLVALLPHSMTIFSIVMLLCLFFTFYFSRSYYGIAMIFAGMLIVMALTFFYGNDETRYAWEFVYARFFDTLLGAAIVIITAYVVFPEKSGENVISLADTLEDELINSLSLLKFDKVSLDRSYQHEYCDAIEKYYNTIIKLNVNFQILKSELNNNMSRLQLTEALIINNFKIHDALVTMSLLFKNPLPLADIEKRFAIKLADYLRLLVSLDRHSDNLVLKLNHAYDKFLDEISDIEKSQDSLIKSAEYSRLVVFMISLRNICVNMRLIAIAKQQLVMLQYG